MRIGTEAEKSNNMVRGGKVMKCAGAGSKKVDGEICIINQDSRCNYYCKTPRICTRVLARRGRKIRLLYHRYICWRVMHIIFGELYIITAGIITMDIVGKCYIHGEFYIIARGFKTLYQTYIIPGHLITTTAGTIYTGLHIRAAGIRNILRS